jgi:Flp pilus assembly protein TadD
MQKLATNRRLLALVVSLCFALTTAWAQHPKPSSKPKKVVVEAPDETSSLIAKAESAMQKQDYTQAESLLKQALEKSPKDYQAWFDLGYIYNATERRAEAIEAFRSSVSAKPDVFESNLNLGLTLASAGQKEEAIAALRRATELKPTAHPDEGHARAWMSLGRLLAESDAAAALEAFSKTAQLTPKDPEPHLSAGEILVREKKYREAETEFRRALELDPSSSDAVIGIANVSAETANYPQAEEMLRKYIAGNQQNGTAHILLGRVLAAQDKNDEARQELELGLQLQPGDNVAARELASMELKARKYLPAEARLRQLALNTPNDAAVHRDLGTALLGQAKYDAAQAELIQSMKLKPDDPETYGQLAIAASNNKDYTTALAALNARAKLAPDTPGTYFLRATVLDHLGDKKQATENYKQFLAVANGKYPDQEWQARHRIIAIDPEKKR